MKKNHLTTVERGKLKRTKPPEEQGSASSTLSCGGAPEKNNNLLSKAAQSLR